MHPASAILHVVLCKTLLQSKQQSQSTPVPRQVGGWLASWLWSTPAVADQGSGAPAPPLSKQAAASEHQASATGTAAWDLIAAHAWDLLHAASLRYMTTSLLAWHTLLLLSPERLFSP